MVSSSPGPIVACSWLEETAEAPALLTLGRRVAERLAASPRWLHLGPLPAGAAGTAAAFGATKLHHLQSPDFEPFRPDPYVEALARYCREQRPKLLLFSQTFDARLVATRLAGRLRSGVLMNGLDLAAAADGGLRVTASAYGGDTHALYRLAGAEPHIVCLMPGVIDPEPLYAPVATDWQAIPVDLSGVEERIRVVQPARAQGPRLEDAQVIVAGGRGLGTAANFALVEELALALGGLAAASRPIVDDGWVDPSHQVGLTGKITRPALYIAAGISGASQHMAGCSAAKTIVAINRDPDAAIFRYARFGAVGDCLEILPEIVRALQEQ